VRTPSIPLHHSNADGPSGTLLDGPSFDAFAVRRTIRDSLLLWVDLDLVLTRERSAHFRLLTNPLRLGAQELGGCFSR
jgi:hypothetical protein